VPEEGSHSCTCKSILCLIPAEIRYFYSFPNVQTRPRAHPVSHLVEFGGVLSPEIKRPGREVGHSTQSDTEAKNGWSYTSGSLNTFSWRGKGHVCLLSAVSAPRHNSTLAVAIPFQPPCLAWRLLRVLRWPVSWVTAHVSAHKLYFAYLRERKDTCCQDSGYHCWNQANELTIELRVKEVILLTKLRKWPDLKSLTFLVCEVWVDLKFD